MTILTKATDGGIRMEQTLLALCQGILAKVNSAMGG